MIRHALSWRQCRTQGGEANLAVVLSSALTAFAEPLRDADGKDEPGASRTQIADLMTTDAKTMDLVYRSHPEAVPALP